VTLHELMLLARDKLAEDGTPKQNGYYKVRVSPRAVDMVVAMVEGHAKIPSTWVPPPGLVDGSERFIATLDDMVFVAEKLS